MISAKDLEIKKLEEAIKIKHLKEAIKDLKGDLHPTIDQKIHDLKADNFSLNDKIEAVRAKIRLA